LSFRDDRDAMRMRIEELERELEHARERIASLEESAVEVVVRGRRIEELEAELAALKESPKQKAKREREAAARQEREARERARRVEDEAVTRDAATPGWREHVTLPRVIGGALVAAPVIFLVYTQCAPPTWPGTSAAPTIGLVDLGVTPAPAAITGTAEGTRSAPIGCAGYVPSAPQLVLRTAGPTFVTLEVSSGGDTVMLLQASDGTVSCDDDSAGSLAPRISTLLPAGEHRVWVGTYQSAASWPFTLAISSAAGSDPDLVADARGLAPTAPPAHGVVSGLLDGARRFTGTAQPMTAVSPISDRCRGFVPMVPALAVALPEPTYVRVDASGGGDPVLFVESDRGQIRCDDDSGPGVAAMIAERFEAGTHRVWVGSYGATPSIDYALEVQSAPIEGGAEPPREPLVAGALVTVPLSAPLVLLDACGHLSTAQPAVIVTLPEQVDVYPSMPVRVEGPDGARCAAAGRTTWPAGEHRVFPDVSPEPLPAAPPTLTLAASPPSVVPYPE
jgi:hypothetical protein